MRSATTRRATRIAGVLYWQVILALYVVSGLLAGIAGLLYVGLIKAPSLSLAEPLLLPSVAAAVIGGTSIFGGRGGYAGTIVGALILTVLTTLLTVLQMPEGSRRILFGLIILAVTAAYIRITEEASASSADSDAPQLLERASNGGSRRSPQKSAWLSPAVPRRGKRRLAFGAQTGHLGFGRPPPGADGVIGSSARLTSLTLPRRASRKLEQDHGMPSGPQGFTEQITLRTRGSVRQRDLAPPVPRLRRDRAGRLRARGDRHRTRSPWPCRPSGPPASTTSRPRAWWRTSAFKR